MTDTVHGHTASWTDGLTVTRLFLYKRKGQPDQIFLRVIWNDTVYEVQLGKRIGKIHRCGRVGE